MSNETKNEWSNDTVPGVDQPVYWEDLIPLKDQTVQILLHQQQLTAEFCKMSAELIAKDPNLANKVKGILNTYKDIADAIAANMRYHITFDENNNIIDHKQGLLDMDSDEYLDYIKITGNYIHAQEQITDIAFNSYADLLTILKTSTGMVSDDDITLLNKTYLQGKKDILNIYNEINNPGGSKPKAKKKKGGKKNGK